LKQTIELC